MKLAHPGGVLTLTAAFFVVLAAYVALVRDVPGDSTVRETVLGLASPTTLVAIRIVNAAGDYRLLVPGTLVVAFLLDRTRARWWLWTGLMVVAAVAPDVLKVVVGRSRPGELSMGFPSGHATAAAAFFGAVIYLAGSLPSVPRRVVRALAFVLVILVGVARVMLRAHWPSDALGGIALGLALAAAAALIDAAWAPRRAALSDRLA